jgi:hypothetical protein
VATFEQLGLLVSGIEASSSVAITTIGVGD